jgi:uncharacterized protein involved in high-affinity Fe2+ transport
MRDRWLGPIVVVLILVGVVLVLALNLNLKGWNVSDSSAQREPRPLPAGTGAGERRPADFREYPIGDAVERNQMRIEAVWLPHVQMEGMAGPASTDVIHIEADIHATEGNPNGCAKDEFIPYLTVRYRIEPLDADRKSDEPIQGPLTPMVARDGWHYGASIAMPRAGHYKLTYTIDPPSAGRHSDAATGVAPWWKRFEVTFDWDYAGPPKA